MNVGFPSRIVHCSSFPFRRVVEPSRQHTVPIIVIIQICQSQFRLANMFEAADER